MDVNSKCFKLNKTNNVQSMYVFRMRCKYKIKIEKKKHFNREAVNQITMLGRKKVV